MTARDIQIAIYRHYYNQDYKLLNSYIYNVSGECDFFSVSKSGYQIEVEIKVSRSDFFVDFKKPKHKFYSAIFSKRSHLVEDLGNATYPQSGSVFGHYDYFIPRSNRRYIGSQSYTKITEELNQHHEMLANYPGFWLEKRRGDLWAQHTKIRIHELSKVYVPHKMYYAAPKGLIKVDEVPVYAGLLELDEYMLNEIKKAPYIHKRPQDITKTLLSKFYYESMDWRRGVNFLIDKQNKNNE